MIGKAFVGNGLTPFESVVRRHSDLRRGKKLLILTPQASFSVVMEFVKMMKPQHLVHLIVATKLTATALYQGVLQLAVESRVAVWKKMMDQELLHSMHCFP